MNIKHHKIIINISDVPSDVWVHVVSPLLVQNGVSLSLVVIIVIQQDKRLVLLKVSLIMEKRKSSSEDQFFQTLWMCIS
jgi:hypothetical protein